MHDFNGDVNKEGVHIQAVLSYFVQILLPTD